MATLLEGPSFYSYDLTVETKINIDELIYILSPMDLPLLSGVGGDGVPILPRTPVDNTIFYWLEEEIPLPRGTCAEVLDDTETALTMATGDAVKFAVGDGIRIDDEVMVITAIDTSTDVIDVTRGSASLTNTTAAAHVINSEVIGLGTILVEGSVGSTNFQGRDRYSNYCQIFSRKIQASRTGQRIPKYGVASELSKQTMNTMQALNLGVEQSALYGVKHLVTATNRRQTGGLDYYIATNEDTTSDWLTVDAIEAQQANAYNNGGMFNVIMSQPKNFAALTNLTGNERVTTVSVEDARRGRSAAVSVMTEYGEVMLARNRWCRNADAFGYSRENFVMRQFQPLVMEKLAKTDDTDTFMMVCELGFQVKGEAHMAKWSGLDATTALPGAGLV